PEIFLINLSDGEQSLEPVLAAGIVMAQELIFTDRRVQVFVPRLELAAHLSQQFGDRNHAGVGFAGGGRDVVHLAIRVCDTLVIAAGPLFLGASVQLLPHLLGFLKLLAGVLLACSRIAGETARARANKYRKDGNRREEPESGAALIERGKVVRRVIPDTRSNGEVRHLDKLPDNPWREPQTCGDREGMQSGGDFYPEQFRL